MYCDNCGAQIQPGDSACRNCGKPVSQFNGAYHQGYNQPQVPIQSRDIALAIVFSILTCGIYTLYWFVRLTEDVNDLTGDHSTSGGMALLFTLITCGIYGIYWAYKQGEKLDYVKQSRGIPSSNSGILYLILEILKLGIVGYALMQNEINKFATIR